MDLLLINHSGIFLGPRTLEHEVALAHAVALLVQPFDIVRVCHGPLKKRRKGIGRVFMAEGISLLLLDFNAIPVSSTP